MHYGRTIFLIYELAQGMPLRFLGLSLVLVEH